MSNSTNTMSWLDIACALRDMSRVAALPYLRRIYRAEMRGAALQHRAEVAR